MHNLHNTLWDVRQKRPIIDEGTALKDIPREWLENVEPTISRRGFNGCWISYKYVNERGVPIYSWRDEDGKRHQTTLAKYVMKIFWNFPDGYFVKRVCEFDQCVNPNHLYLCPNAWGH